MKTVRLKEKEFFTTAEAANLLSLKTSTLHQWRWAKKGPKFTRMGSRTIRYHSQDLINWIESSNGI
jgi:excisionase family DNA binding protein